MSNSRSRVGVLVAALVLPQVAFGVPFTLASVDVTFDAIANYDASGASTASLSKAATTASGLSAADASAFAGAEVGHLRSFVEGATSTLSGGLGDGLGQGITARPRSISRFSDSIMFASPGVQGRVFTVTASLLFDGNLTTIANASGFTPIGDATARSQITVQLVGTGLPNDFHLAPFSGAVAAGAKAEAHYPIGPSVSVNVEVPVVVPVVFTARVGSATPIQYVMDMQGFAQSSVFRNSASDLNSSSSIVGNYSNSLSWGGITTVTDEDGNPITDFTALGEDGFNYRNAFASTVPEPASLVLLLSGGVALGARRWRKLCETTTRLTGGAEGAGDLSQVSCRRAVA